MPIINTALLNILNNTSVLAQKDVQRRNKALEALMQANPSNNEVRQAVINNLDFWNEYAGLIPPETAPAAPSTGFFAGMAAAASAVVGTLTPAATTPSIPPASPTSHYLDNDDFLKNEGTNDFARLRQLAIEQRIKLGLSAIDDNAFTAILGNNPAEVRAYLATKSLAFSDLTQIKGWEPSVTPEAAAPAPGVPPEPKKAPLNNSQAAVSDSTIQSIRIAASEEYLVRLIKRAKNKDHLVALLTPATYAQAAKALEYPGTPLTNITDAMLKGITARTKELDVQAASSGIGRYIQNLTPAQIESFKDELANPDIAGFQAKLADPYKTSLNAEGLKTAKRAVGDRYFQAELAKQAGNVVLALNEGDDAKFKTALKTLIAVDPHDYIDNLSTPEDFLLMRKALLKALINNSNSAVDLKALDNLDDNLVPLAKFKEVLTKKFKVTHVSWIPDTDLGEMKQWVRTKAFTLMLKDASAHGLESHPSLIALFDKFSIADQRKILTKPNLINQLLIAHDIKDVENLLGRGFKGASEIAAENAALDNKNGALKNLFNPELAKIIAKLNPPVVLSTGKVASINLFLRNKHQLEGHKEYIDLVKSIRDEVKPTKLEEFYNAFGINSAGTALNSDAESSQTHSFIAERHAKNLALLELLKNPLPPHELKIFSVFVSLDSTVEDNPTAQVIRENLSRANTLKKFIESFAGDENADLRIKLAQNITADQFKEIKTEERRLQFTPKADITEVSKAIKETRNSLEQFKADRKLLVQDKKKMNRLLDIANTDLLNPAFQAKGKTESAAHLQELNKLAERCDLVVDQLHRERSTLKRHIDIMPKRASPKVADDVSKLKTDLHQELKAVEADLKIYEAVQTKLHGEKGIIAAVEKEAGGKSNLVYEPDELEVSEPVISKLPDAIEKAVKPKSATAEDTATTIETKKRKPVSEQVALKDSLGVNKVRLFESKYKANTTNGHVVILNTVFSEQHIPNSAGALEGKFQLLKFPSAGEGVTVTSVDLALSKVKGTLDMAVQVLGSFDTMPTKDQPLELSGHKPDELKFVYRALISLGVDKKAIDVRSTAFNPDEEFGLLGWKKESPFESKKAKRLVEQSRESLKLIRAVKDDKTGTREKTHDAVSSANKMFKQKHEDVLKKVQGTIEEEGPAKPGPRSGG